MCAQTLDIELSHSLLPLINIRISVVACTLNVHLASVYIKFNKLTRWPSDIENINIHKQLTKIIDVYVITCTCIFDIRKCNLDVDCNRVDFWK